jgi:hypothetical protein
VKRSNIFFIGKAPLCIFDNSFSTCEYRHKKPSEEALCKQRLQRESLLSALIVGMLAVIVGGLVVIAGVLAMVVGAG